jgi:hypothetical protein
MEPCPAKNDRPEKNPSPLIRIVALFSLSKNIHIVSPGCYSGNNKHIINFKERLTIRYQGFLWSSQKSRTLIDLRTFSINSVKKRRPERPKMGRKQSGVFGTTPRKGVFHGA